MQVRGPGPGTYFVGVTGFEPATLRSQSGCATKLRYTPLTDQTLPCRSNGVFHPEESGKLAQAATLAVRSPSLRA